MNMDMFFPSEMFLAFHLCLIQTSHTLNQNKIFRILNINSRVSSTPAIFLHYASNLFNLVNRLTLHDILKVEGKAGCQ